MGSSEKWSLVFLRLPANIQSAIDAQAGRLDWTQSWVMEIAFQTWLTLLGRGHFGNEPLSPTALHALADAVHRPEEAIASVDSVTGQHLTGRTSSGAGIFIECWQRVIPFLQQYPGDIFGALIRLPEPLRCEIEVEAIRLGVNPLELIQQAWEQARDQIRQISTPS